MPKRIRPIDIARELNISTSTLRHYEAWGIVPAVGRTDCGYREYTETHIAFYHCIRAMEPGFGMKLTGNVMRKLINGKLDEALWAIAEAKVALVQERHIALQTIRLLEQTSKISIDGGRAISGGDPLTIGRLAKQSGIPATAIRYWEQAGLFTADRGASSKYRIYNETVLQKVLLIRTLRTSGFSLEVIRSVLDELNKNGPDHAIVAANDSLKKLELRIRDQLRGEHQLYALCRLLGLLS